MHAYFEDIWINHRIIVGCQEGLEPVLAQELRNQGMTNIHPVKRAVICQGSTADLIRLNMSLHTALNIAIPIRTFKADSYDMVYFRAKKIHWHKLFPVEASIRISVKGHSSLFPNSQFLIHRVKDAIMDTFRKFYEGKRPSVNRENPDIHIMVHIQKDQVTLLLDSSGIPLFKRGYRDQQGEAPLKEDLAAAICRLSGWDEKTPILDPFCGSGTILVEAYFWSRNIPPNLFRQFSFQHWIGFDSSQVQPVRRKLMESIIPFTGNPFTGIEMDASTVSKARGILNHLNIDKEIRIIHRPFQEVTGSFRDYFILTNPPYGERLGNKKNVQKLFAGLRLFVDTHGPFSGMALLVPRNFPDSWLPFPPKKKIPLLNGKIPVNLIQF